MKAVRRRHPNRIWLCAAAVLLATSAAADPPNIVVFQGDDWGWPHYGFMQRYLQSRTTGTCAGGTQVGQTCQTNGACPESICASELVGDDKTQPGLEYLDPAIMLPDQPDPGRPPVDQLLTPALDWLAAHGNFWPVAHTSASRSQPAFAIIMTGLYPLDWVLRTEPPFATTSPVIPEWLPTSYLTLAAGKWQWGLSHVLPDGQLKTPWDRQVGESGSVGEGGRLVPKPYEIGVPEDQALAGLALERVKDFIACARCTDPSKCLQPPAGDAPPDSARMALRAAPGACTPQPFFVFVSPFIPHLQYRFDEFCPFFPRNALQCGTEPWQSLSHYCTDPSGFDWSCASYAAGMEAAVRAPGAARKVTRTKLEYLKFVNAFDRMIDELLVYLQCPGGASPGCGEDLMANTVVIHNADHGTELTGSKTHFRENGYRVPKVLYDPRPGNTLPASPDRCGGQPGCRSDFAHAVDLLPTIAELSGSTFTCDASCDPCDPSCPNACPCPRPDGQSRYSEGRSLRAPITRACDTADPSYLQCVLGRKKGNQGVNTVLAGWYVLAEVADGANPTHLCKLEVSCGTPVALYDIRSDPNERANLMKRPPSFCSSRVQELVSLLRDGITARGWYDPCFELKLP